MPRIQTPLAMEYILLGFISEGPIHGYDLFKRISCLESTSLVWQIKRSHLYSLLEKLEMDGYLTSRIVPGAVHLLRKEYLITPKGKQAFLAWFTAPVMHGRDMRQEFLAKLYFVQLAGKETSLALIKKQKIVCMERLSGLQESYFNFSDEHHYERMIFQYRIYQTQATIDWLDECQREIQDVQGVTYEHQ